MSSTYGLICLNHDPAIEFGDHESVYDPEPMIAAAKYPADHQQASGHERCDLVVARYSYPIVEILCPGKGERGFGCRWHDKPIGVSDDHMRLLIAAYQSSDVPGWVTEPFSSRCWKRERALRLGPLLGLPGGEAKSVDGVTVEPSVGSRVVDRNDWRWRRQATADPEVAWACSSQDGRMFLSWPKLVETCGPLRIVEDGR